MQITPTSWRGIGRTLYPQNKRTKCIQIGLSLWAVVASTLFFAREFCALSPMTARLCRFLWIFALVCTRTELSFLQFATL